MYYCDTSIQLVLRRNSIIDSEYQLESIQVDYKNHGRGVSGQPKTLVTPLVCIIIQTRHSPFVCIVQPLFAGIPHVFSPPRCHARWWCQALRLRHVSNLSDLPLVIDLQRIIPSNVLYNSPGHVPGVMHMHLQQYFVCIVFTCQNVFLQIFVDGP